MAPKSQPKSCGGGGGCGLGDGGGEWGLGDGPHFSEGVAAYLHGLRSLRAGWFTGMLLLARWATPALLTFADTALVYSIFAAIGSFCLALHRRIYHTHSWSATLRGMPQAVRLFNQRLLAPASQRGIELLPHHPRSLEWFVWEAPPTARGASMQRYEPSVTCSMSTPAYETPIRITASDADCVPQARSTAWKFTRSAGGM